MTLTKEQKNQFFQDGYIVVKELLTTEELETLRNHYADLALGRVPDYPEGNVSHHTPGTAQAAEPPTPHGSRHDRRGTQVYPKGEVTAPEDHTPVEDPLDTVKSSQPAFVPPFGFQCVCTKPQNRRHHRIPAGAGHQALLRPSLCEAAIRQSESLPSGFHFLGLLREQLPGHMPGPARRCDCRERLCAFHPGQPPLRPRQLGPSPLHADRGCARPRGRCSTEGG